MHYTMKLSGGRFLLAVAVLSAAVGWAQTNRGQLNGRISDSSGAVIPDVTIEATSPDTGVRTQATSNTAGQYLMFLPPGRHDVRVTLTGFAPQLITGVLISGQTTTTLDVEMQVATVAEEVTVTASAAQLDTADTNLSVTVEDKLLRDVPIPVSGSKRRAFQYLDLSPTVQKNGFNATAGGREQGIVILLDGLPNDQNNMNFGENAADTEPSVESIGEYKISLATPAAEFGRTSGAIMSYVTKSGTNQFHGSAWDYHNNSVLQARPWRAASRGNSRSNEFGVAAGGPIRIPGVYNGSNRTFFFSTLDFFRQSASGSAGSLVTMPTQAMRQGDFSHPDLNTLYDITDRFTDQDGTVRRRPFPNNQIPVSRMSRVSGFFMNLFPLPNTGGGAPELNFVGGSSRSFTPWDFTYKMDHNFTDNHRFSWFYHYGTAPRTDTDAELGEDFGNVRFNKVHRIRFDYNWVVSPNIVNTSLFGQNYHNFGEQLANFGEDLGVQAGLVGYPDPNCPDFAINPAGAGSLSVCGIPAETESNVITSFSNTTLYNKGAHTIKFGFQSLIYHVDHVDLGGFAGGSFVSASGTQSFGWQGAAQYTTDTDGTGGFPMADFFLGLPFGVATVSNTDVKEREAYHGFFIQDDWKVTPRLTLNLGLRWDINVPFSTLGSQYTGLDVNLPNTAASGRLGALEYYGTGPGRNGKSRPGRINYNDFGPRFGLAYQIDDKTVLRAGAGILQTAIQSFNARGINRTGFQAGGSPLPNPDPFGVFFQWDNPFPSDILGTPPFTDPTFRNNQGFGNWMREQDIGKSPEVYNLSFGLQRQLTENIIVEATYFGNLLRHASDHGPQNQLFPQFRSLGPLLDMNINDPRVLAAGFSKPYPEFPDELSLSRALRPFPQFDGIDNAASIITGSNYHAFMLKATQRFSNGLTFLAHWTTSKQIADTDWGPGTFGASPSDQYNRKLDRAVERFDTPQRLVLSYSYELPFGPGRKWASSPTGLNKYLLGGWTISGVHEYMSGYPASVSGGLQLGIPNGPSTRADRISGVPLRSSIACGDLEFRNPQKNYILNAGNPAQAARTGRPLAFQSAGDYNQGNAPEFDQEARHCGNKNENFTIFKRIPIKERLSIVIGADCINCLNHHRWLTFKFGQGVSGSNFGQITPEQVYGPKVVQLRMRVEW